MMRKVLFLVASILLGFRPINCGTLHLKGGSSSIIFDGEDTKEKAVLDAEKLNYIMTAIEELNATVTECCGDGGEYFGAPTNLPSCMALLQKGFTEDGIYKITLKGTEIETFCDMTTDGGGWTLVTYAYTASKTTGVYLRPVQFSNNWDPEVRNNVASVDATELTAQSTEAMLTNSNGGSPVTGGGSMYAVGHRWRMQDNINWDMSDQSTCRLVTVTDIKTGSTFSAYQQLNRNQVSCSGNKAGGSYERAVIGFNSNGCYGACGWDPVNSNGMIIVRGSGYCPFSANGHSCPERPASFAFWLR